MKSETATFLLWLLQIVYRLNVHCLVPEKGRVIENVVFQLALQLQLFQHKTKTKLDSYGEGGLNIGRNSGILLKRWTRRKRLAGDFLSLSS